LSEETYSDCTITVTDSAGNVSNTLTITSFIVDTSAATLVEVTAVTTPTNDNTPDYTFSSSEAGAITYGGSCSSGTTSATTDNNTITLVSLSDDTYSDCTITVTDNASNGVTMNISSFVVDTTAPTVTSVSTTADNQSSVATTDNITVTFSEAMNTTYVTTNTDNTSCYGTLGLSSDNFSSCVQMSTSPSSSSDNITFTLDPVDNLTEGTTYKTRVTTGVRDTAGNTLSSQYETSSGFTTPLPAPANLSATAGYKQVALDWDNVTGASSYTVYWDNATGVSTSSTAIINVSDDNYTHTGLTGGATYYYKVAAVNSSGTGTLSSEDNATAGSSQLMGGSMQGKELNLTTKVTTFAGSGGTGDTNNNNGLLATFWKPREMTTDGTNLYVAESTGHKIRQVVISTTAVSKLAGKYGGGVADGAYNVGSFFYPNGVTTDGTNVYVAMGSIRKIVISTKVTSTLISGLADVLGITSDGTNLYITDKGDHIVEKVVISSLQRSTIAGTGSLGSSDHTTGTLASFDEPRGITTDGTNLYVADYENHKIRKIVISTGAVSTLAGSGTASSTDNTDGTLATFNNPAGITTDGTNLYVTEYTGRKVRKIVISSGVVTTIAGSGDQGSQDHTTGISATFNGPWGITTDGTYLYVTGDGNLIRRIE